MNQFFHGNAKALSFVLQIYGQQLYYIRSHILHFYDSIKDLDLSTTSESNLTELYDIFSELYEVGHMDVDNEICELILRDPAIQPLFPTIHASYSNFFSLHETQTARNILGSENPWKMLNLFPCIRDMKI